jgi:hypothetical protein
MYFYGSKIKGDYDDLELYLGLRNTRNAKVTWWGKYKENGSLGKRWKDTSKCIQRKEVVKIDSGRNWLRHYRITLLLLNLRGFLPQTR